MTRRMIRTLVLTILGVSVLALAMAPSQGWAQVAGGDWPSRIERAMFSQVDMSEPSKGHQLLIDMIEVMDGDIHTSTLIQRLCKLEDSPWSDYNYKENLIEKRRIRPHQIARLTDI